MDVGRAVARELDRSAARCRSRCPGSGGRRRPARWNRCRQTRKLPWVGTKTPGSQIRSGSGSGKRSRPPSSVQRGAGRAAGSRARAAPGAGRAGGPPAVRPSAARAAATWSGPTPQQPPISCAPSARQRSGEGGEVVAADRRLEAPAVGGRVAEVGVDAEREVGEVAQPRHACPPRGRAGCSSRAARRPRAPRSGAPRGRTRRPPARPSAGRRRRTRRGGSGGSSARPGARWRAAPRRSRSVESRTSASVSTRIRSGGSSSSSRASSVDRVAALGRVDVAVEAERDSAVAAVADRLAGQAGRRAARRPSSGRARSTATAAGRRGGARSAAPTCWSRSRRSPPRRSAGGPRARRRASRRARSCPTAAPARGRRLGDVRRARSPSPPSRTTQRPVASAVLHARVGGSGDLARPWSRPRRAAAAPPADTPGGEGSPIPVGVGQPRPAAGRRRVSRR